MPDSARFNYGLELIARCHYFWVTGGRQTVPNIREIAEMDTGYLDDLMLFDQWVEWIESNNKGRVG